eukprot:Sdes_comp17782_c0_seq2m7046
MEARGCPKIILKLTKALMCNDPTMLLHVNGSQNHRILKPNRGLMQGSILSPALFSIFIDDLCVMTNRNDNVQTLFFVDDINIQAKNHLAAKQTLFICEKWAHDNGMTWGIPKCGSLGSNLPFMLNNELIPMVKQYKYLGFPRI